ncbi:MAG: hypothetical protein ACI3T9_00825 [Romboutsia timonensis]
MIFPFTVKHNGVLYEPGKKVPIGQEPKKELQVEDKTASELSKELKDKYGIDMAPQKGKAKLQEALEEAEKKAKELEPEEDDEESDGEKDLEDGEPEEGNEDGNPEDDDQSFLEKIINE